MTLSNEVFGFNPELALLLAIMSYQAYILNENAALFLPDGFKLKSTITTVAGEAFGYIAESRDTIIVAFRGTKTLTNISSYLDAIQIQFPFVKNSGKTHRGITKIYQSFRNTLINEIKRLSPKKGFMVTGHSLGGSLAALLTLDVAVHTKFKNPILYSFASLPIADHVFTKRFYDEVKNSIRIVNVYDAISNCMTPLFFKNRPLLNLPVGQEFQLNFNNNRFIQNHRILCYIHFLSKRYPHSYRTLCEKYPGFCPDTSMCE
jgi:triacylglycerol lipase